MDIRIRGSGNENRKVSFLLRAISSSRSVDELVNWLATEFDDVCVTTPEKGPLWIRKSGKLTAYHDNLPDMLGQCNACPSEDMKIDADMRKSSVLISVSEPDI